MTLFLCLLITGCTSEETLRREVQTDRTHAYQQWQRNRDNQQQLETTIAGQLSLADSITLAMTNSKPLLAVVEEKEIAQGRILESYSQALPSLTANTGYTRLDRPQSMTFNSTPITIGNRNNYSANLQVIQPVFRGGQITAALRAANIFSCLTDERIRAAVQETILEVTRTYYTALLRRNFSKSTQRPSIPRRRILKMSKTKRNRVSFRSTISCRHR